MGQDHYQYIQSFFDIFICNYFLESLRRFYEALVTNNTNCKVDDDKGMEDVEMGKCLKAVGVRNEDSRDNHGRYRFLPLTPTDHIQSRKWKNPSFWMWSYYKHDQMQVLSEQS